MGKYNQVLVGDIAESIQYGYTGKTVDKGSYKYLRITDIQNQKVDWDNVPISDISSESEIKKYKLEINDILFARTGATVGKSFLIEEVKDSIFASYLIRIKPKDTIEPRFLYLFFQSQNYWDQISDHKVGAALPNVNGKKLAQIRIPLPSLNEQKEIVLLLDRYIDNIDKSIFLLEENLKHSTALISSVLDEEFKKVESNYNQFPLSEIVEVINGRAYKKHEMLASGKYPIMRVGNFFSNREWYYSDLELEDNKYCESGDLLYAWSASFGPRIWEGEKCIYHYHIWKLVPLTDQVSKKFLYYLLERDTEKIKEEGGRGVGMIHLTKAGFEKRLLVLPPLNIQEEIIKKIEDIYNLNNNLTLEINSKIDNLKALKESILDKAFKGELI